MMIFTRQLTSPSPLIRGLLLVSVLLSISLIKTQTVHASYNGGQLISNSVFLDSNSMTKEKVQSFLVSKGSGLAQLSMKLECKGAGSKEREAYTAVGGTCDTNLPASHIIYYAAQIYGVSPQVVLATLQKEQGLITSPNPTSWQLNHAMGYGCPTTGTCTSSTFSYQIDAGVWLQRFHYERANGNMIWWSTSTSWVCGVEKNFYKPNLYPGQDVRFYDEDGVQYRTHFIVNAATSSMYCYTPHAYNNPKGLYGLPAYGTKGRYYTGSYNFVKFFELWFGPTVRERIMTVSYDSSTDNTGELATIGFRLSTKPTGNVTVPVVISTPENARITSGLTYVVITPETWNQPKFNKLQIAGLFNPDQVGTITYKLDLLRPTSSDARYQNLASTHYPDVFLVHQDVYNPPSVFRLYDGVSKKNYFTASTTEKAALLTSGWQDKGVAFSYCPAGDTTVLRLRKNNERVLAVENSALHTQLITDGYELESVNFAASRQGSVPIYWFNNTTTGDHFYTTSAAAMTGYTSKGVAFNACAAAVKPVYRLYNRESQSYYYTASPKERKTAMGEKGFGKYEGTAFYVCETGTEVSRLFRASSNSYFLTTSDTEKANLIADSHFIDQGVSFSLCADSHRDVYTLYKPSTGVNLQTAFDDEKDDFVDNIGYRNLGVLFESK